MVTRYDNRRIFPNFQTVCQPNHRLHFLTTSVALDPTAGSLSWVIASPNILHVRQHPRHRVSLWAQTMLRDPVHQHVGKNYLVIRQEAAICQPRRRVHESLFDQLARGRRWSIPEPYTWDDLVDLDSET